MIQVIETQRLRKTNKQTNKQTTKKSTEYKLKPYTVK